MCAFCITFRSSKFIHCRSSEPSSCDIPQLIFDSQKILHCCSSILQASNGTITVPNISGGSSQYVVTSTGLNLSEQTSAATTASVTQLSESVSSVDKSSKLVYAVCKGNSTITDCMIGLEHLSPTNIENTMMSLWLDALKLGPYISFDARAAMLI